MQIQDLIQGSPEWLAYRATHFNASDAPAMMGCSPYKTRAELLRELHTGLNAEVDASTQRRFDDGHRFEALARPLAESIIGEDLYPVTGSNGRLSASFDGLTLGNDVVFEHKTLGEPLRYTPWDEGNGTHLPLHYRVQLEQQLMVSGAERALFMATRWEGENCAERRHCWYTADAELRANILRGWDQFAADLAAYTPPEVVAPVTAAPQEQLPAVSVQVQGSLAVVSNLTAFGTALRAFVAKIPTQPSTDQEFADTEAACKRLKEAEDRLQSAEDQALASMADVNEMRRLVAEFRDVARTARLAAEKTVKARKEQIRGEEVSRGSAALRDHIQALNARIGRPLMPVIASDFAGVIKSLRTLDSVRNAIDTELARAKIEANAAADRITVNLRAIEQAQAPHLFPDTQTLVLKAADDLLAVVGQRVAAEQQRKQAEEDRRAAEEAQRIAAAEQRAREQEAARLAEQQRQQDADEAARLAIEQAKNTQAQDSQQVLKAEPATADATARETPANTSPSVGSMGAGQAADAAPVAEEPATLKLGIICERLGFVVTAAFLADVLHIQHAATDKRAMLYRESQWPVICRQLQAHIGAMAELYGRELV